MPLPSQALIFSIYTMAIISTSEDEALLMFGMSKDEALSTFTMGAKLALIRLDFLRNYDMAALQALILFLWSMAGKSDRSAAWMLSGVIVRVAQRAGYHRDGEQLGLGPFETEMRRRIWWQIFVQDSTFSMASDLAPSLMPANWDTKEPRNFNDADLYPNCTELAAPKDGPTEMAFCLVLYRLYKLSAEIANIPGLDSVVLTQQTTTQQAARTQLRLAVAEMDRNVKEVEDKYVDPRAGNAHVAAKTLRPALLKKLAGMVPPDGSEQDDLSMIRTLLTTLEHACESYQQMAACRFEWAMKLTFRSDLLAALVGQLSTQSKGEMADRGWAVVERTYAQQPQLFDMTRRQYLEQGRSTLAAWSSRQTASPPDFITRLRNSIAQADDLQPSADDTTLLEADLYCWPDWEGYLL